MIQEFLYAGATFVMLSVNKKNIARAPNFISDSNCFHNHFLGVCARLLKELQPTLKKTSRTNEFIRQIIRRK